MAVPASPPPLGQQSSLAALLAEAVDGVVQAQRRLDQDAQERVTRYVATPQGGVALPPLWFGFSEVTLQLELAASVTRITTVSAPEATDGSLRSGVRLDCRLVNPAAVSLFGYRAASGFKVSLTLAPQDAAGLRPVPPTPAAPGG
jgi:nucleoid-associated protein YgaU